MVLYTVRAGDTLDSIAREYGLSPSRIAKQNGLANENKLTVGMNLVLTFPAAIYTAREGDTLFSIAESYGVTINDLWKNNPELNGLTSINIGQTLIISYDLPDRKNTAVNGYIYPFIEKGILTRTLPYLTYLTIFTYGLTENGDLVDRGITEFGIDEDELIDLSYNYRVAPIMHLSTLTKDGVFDSRLGNMILNDVEAQNRLIDNIIKRMKEKNYYGLDVDFEYLDASNRDKYTTFLGRVQNALSDNGFILITALIPKASTDQGGDLYQSHDYGGIGSVSDYVLLMTYEWGYTYGPPMAVAPINEVEKVVEYALTQIPSGKIFLGIPNYAYDWKLPYVSGESKAEKLTNQQAIDLAINKGVKINFDERAQTPYFKYTQDAVEHIVWFDDARSIDAKLELLHINNLYGPSYWNIMQWFSQNWLIFNQKYNNIKVV